MQGHTKNRGGCVSEESHQLKDTPSTVSKSDSTKDHPPGYDDHARAAMVFRSTQPTANTLSKPKGNPTNYLSVSKMHGPIIGTYIINPSMHVPPTYLPPLGGGETERDRKNLHLHTHTHNGSVDVDIWLVGDQRHPEARKDRTTLHHRANHVFLPRSFHGPVALESRYGSHTLSEELLQNSTLLGVAGYTTRFFVGDFLAACDSVSQWEDYELKAETRDGWVGTMTNMMREMSLAHLSAKLLRDLAATVLAAQ
ncbi:hypothetical protein F5141DRAFT_1067143 [Pisolithus sp. B1]|nr:hypothetical protein F5141DRAFT_1067143 [Pisolithus sp. B1]